MKKINGLTVAEYCCCGKQGSDIWDRQMLVWKLGFDGNLLKCSGCAFYPWFIAPYQIDNVLEEREALKWMNS